MKWRFSTILTFGPPLHKPLGIFSSSGVFHNYSWNYTLSCVGCKTEIATVLSTQRGNLRTWWNLTAFRRVLANEGGVLGVQGELPNSGSLRRCCHHLSWPLVSVSLVWPNLKLREIFKKKKNTRSTNWYVEWRFSAETRSTYRYVVWMRKG